MKPVRHVKRETLHPLSRRIRRCIPLHVKKENRRPIRAAGRDDGNPIIRQRLDRMTPARCLSPGNGIRRRTVNHRPTGSAGNHRNLSSAVYALALGDIPRKSLAGGPGNRRIVRRRPFPDQTPALVDLDRLIGLITDNDRLLVPGQRNSRRARPPCANERRDDASRFHTTHYTSFGAKTKPQKMGWFSPS